jgi:EAL domain-containing protein (putative c-di-GMP-specific phosphodiesterase class I)/DNA-binding response OmpR family regulator
MKHVRESVTERAENAAPAAALDRGVRVLVIDDDKYMRSVVGRLLNTLGVDDYCEAGDGVEGVRAIEDSERAYDLTILDIDMPNSDGMGFLRSMGERQYPNPIMILSGKPIDLLNSVQLMAQGYGLNILPVGQKPPSIAVLKEALASCRSAARVERAMRSSNYSKEEILAGLENREFEAFFQPKVEIPSRRLRGCEALARWRHLRDGVIGQGAFIPVLEAAKRMDDLTWIVLEQAASWCRRWHDAGLSFTVSVNLSVSSLSDGTIADRVYDIVSAAGVEPRSFVLEVTETVAMTDVLQCVESLCRLRLKGFGLSIDDFGTGFSSLQQLTRVPYTELKIDQVFVNGAATSPQRRTVLESSIEIAKKLGLTAVAEGVETEEDWNLLHALGCQLAQGYFIAKPLSGEEFTIWAASNDWSSLTYTTSEERERSLPSFSLPGQQTSVDSRGCGVRILIVEDEPFQRRVLGSVLKSSSSVAKITEVDSGSAAISLLETEPVDVIISDIAMPGLNGLDLLRKIRSGQSAARRDIPFLILTSYSNTDVLNAAMALDVSGFIVKPFTARLVLEKIKRTMNEKIKLRPDFHYDSVVTDLASLPGLKLSANDSGADLLRTAPSADGSQARTAIPFSELRAGMRVAERLTALDGTVILAAETTLTQPLINLLSDLTEIIAAKVLTVYRDVRHSMVR